MTQHELKTAHVNVPSGNYKSLFSYLRPSFLVTDEFFVLKVNRDGVTMRHGEHQATSIRCPYNLLIRDLLRLSEELLINVCEDAEDRQ